MPVTISGTTGVSKVQDNVIETADPIPVEPTPIDPVQKLKDFLAANPDVVEIL